MQWKRNPWVGVAAVVMMAAAIGGAAYWFNSGRGKPPVENHPALKFQCEATGKIFEVTQAEIEDQTTYLKYHVAPGSPAPCRIDDKSDAYQVYFCRVEGKYYRWGTETDAGDSIKCPNGHVVDQSDQ